MQKVIELIFITFIEKIKAMNLNIFWIFVKYYKCLWINIVIVAENSNIMHVFNQLFFKARWKEIQW